MDKGYDAYISYSQKDKPWVEKLVFILEDKGVDTWVDFIKLKNGDLF